MRVVFVVSLAVWGQRRLDDVLCVCLQAAGLHKSSHTQTTINVCVCVCTTVSAGLCAARILSSSAEVFWGLLRLTLRHNINTTTTPRRWNGNVSNRRVLVIICMYVYV